MEYALEKILDLTNDHKSLPFWKMAIKKLGQNSVLEEVSETDYLTRKGSVKNPAKYLTSLLNKKLKKLPKQKTPDKIKTHFEKTQLDLFQNLMPVKVPEKEIGITKSMPMAFSEKNIPWPTFLGPEFFTLSTNRKKSDKVKMTSHAMDGTSMIVNLIRGKVSLKDRERGILTVQHEKIFAALKYLWAKNGCKCSEFEDGTVICTVTVSARELAKTLGWKTFGGWEINHLKTFIMDLKSMPYFIDFTDTPLNKIKGYSFTLLGDFTGIDLKKQGGEASYFQVSFSSTVSWQLAKNHIVTRSKNLLFIRSELATLLWLYIEPILRTHKDFTINLKNLVKALQLPKADWHNKEFERKRQFIKAIKELNTLGLIDDHKITLTIEKGLFDWQLHGQIKENLKQIEN